MSARNSVEDYAGVLRRLLPRGRVWPDEPGSTQSKVLSGLAATAERIDAAANALLGDAFPTTTIELLPEWESSLGLPDPCLGGDPTGDQRRAQVRARFLSQGRPTRDAIIAYAAALGFVISIGFASPYRVGRGRVGQPVAGAAWAHACRVKVLSSVGSLQNAAFRAGRGAAGQRLNKASAALATLACELRQIVPAHVVLLITF